jgi:hypothetical protein
LNAFCPTFSLPTAKTSTSFNTTDNALYRYSIDLRSYTF